MRKRTCACACVYLNGVAHLAVGPAVDLVEFVVGEVGAAVGAQEVLGVPHLAQGLE